MDRVLSDGYRTKNAPKRGHLVFQLKYLELLQTSPVDFNFQITSGIPLANYLCYF